MGCACALGLLFGLSGCSSDSPPDPALDPPSAAPDAKGPSIYEYYLDYTDEFCDAFTAPICDATVFYNLPNGWFTCIQNDAAVILSGVGRLEQSETDGNLTFNKKRAKRCLKDWKESCWVLREGYGVPESCLTVFSGNVEVNGSCHVDAECKGAASYCRGGADCASAGECSCPGTCQPRLGLGESCNTGHQCVSQVCVDKKCAERPVHDGDCAPGSQCTFYTACVDPGFVNGKTTCQYTTDAYVGTTGETCAPGTQLCERYSACVNNVCVKAAGAGEACSAAKPCLQGYKCVDGTCHVPPTLGEACTAPYSCGPGLGCMDGTCQYRLMIGKPCESGDYCRSNECRAGKCTYHDTCYF